MIDIVWIFPLLFTSFLVFRVDDVFQVFQKHVTSCVVTTGNVSPWSMMGNKTPETKKAEEGELTGYTKRA